MRPISLAAFVPWIFCALAPYAQRARAGPELSAESALCQAAIAKAEASHHVPDGFLAAIARVESGRPDKLTGATLPWPWTVNAAGAGSFYGTEAEAIAAVTAQQKAGVHLIDVGCLQVDLGAHPRAFGSLSQAFDPDANAAYAADFLVSLFNQTGSWPRAAAAYHSMTPGVGAPYGQRVLAEWAIPQTGRSIRPPAPASAPRPQVAQTASAYAPAGRMAGLIAPQAGLARPAAMIGRSLASYRDIPTRLANRPPNPS